MVNDINKNSASDSIDVNGLRAEVQKDPRFFKDKAYTRSGKERLAAIQEIEDVQKKDLKYKIYDNDTFDIVDKSGKIVETEAGKGVETGKKIGMLYGMLNKEKRSKKEVSTILGGIKKLETRTIAEQAKDKIADPVIEKRDETKPVTEVKSTLAEGSKTSATPVKSGSLDESTEIVAEAAKQLTATEKREAKVAEEKMKKAPVTAKVNGDPTSVEVIPEVVNTPIEFSGSLNQIEQAKKSELDSTLNSALNNINISNNVIVNREGDFYKKAIKHIKALSNKDTANLEAYKERLEVIKAIEDPNERTLRFKELTKLGVGGMDGSTYTTAATNKYLNDYKNYRQIIYGEKINNLEKLMQSLESNNSFSPEFKRHYKEKAAFAHNNLKRLRDDFNNKNLDSINKEMTDQFGQELNNQGVVGFRKGGSITKFQTGGGFYNAQGRWVDENGMVDFSKPLNKEEPFSSMASKKEYSGLLSEQTDNGFKPTNSSEFYEAYKNPVTKPEVIQTKSGTYRITPSEKNNSVTQGNEETKAAKRKEITDFLSTKTLDLTALIPTALKWKIAKDAMKNPVAKVQAPQDIFRPGYVHGVRSVKGLDNTSLQIAKNKITSQRSEYSGSDPVMDTVFKQMSARNKAEGLSEISLKNAEAIRQSEDSQRQDLELNMQGANANIQGEVAVRNLNNRERAKADFENAIALAKNKSDLAANNIAAITEGAAILANKRVTDQQFRAGLDAEKIKGDREALHFDATNKLAAIDKAKYAFQHEGGTQAAITEAKNDYKTALDAYKNYDTEGKIASAKTAADREGGVLDFVSGLWKAKA